MERIQNITIIAMLAISLSGLLVIVAFDRGSEVGAQEQHPAVASAIEPPSDDQLAALADGIVTEDELRAALNRAADCLEANGVNSVRPGHPQLEGHLVLGSYYPDGTDPSSYSPVVRRCNERHAILLSAWWAEAGN